MLNCEHQTSALCKQMGSTTMNVNIHWRDEQRTILYQNFNGPWTVDDYYRTVDHTYDLMNQVDHPVDIIADFSANAAAFCHLLAAAGKAEANQQARVHRNQRRIVVVGGGTYMKSLLNMGRRVAPHLMRNLFQADTLEEAHATLQRSEVRA